MPFWRRRGTNRGIRGRAGDAPAPEEVEPGWEPDPADFEDDAARRTSARHRADAEPPSAAEPVPTAVVRRRPRAEHVGSLDAGLERTRSGFMARLRGVIASDPDGPSWDEVEETLIAGDVGAELAIEHRRHGPLRQDPGGALASVRTELASRLVAPRPRLGAAAVGRRRPGGRPRRRRQRDRQDDDDRQAREPLSRPAARTVHPRRRRHVPGRGHRAAAHLGGSRRRAGRRARAGRRSRRPSSTTPWTRRSRGARTSSSSTPPAGCTRSRTSWTSWPRSAGSSTSACRAPSRRSSSCSTRRPGRTASPRRRPSTRRSA